jgi:hypothetical protein
VSTQSVKQWVFDRLTASITAVPGSYPHDACAGILAAVGFGISDVTIFIDRPAENIQVQTKAAIVINDPEEDEDQKTAGGASGQIVTKHTIELDVSWMADFVGKPAAIPPVLPSYTDEDLANRHNRKFLQAIKRTLRLSTYTAKSAGVIMAANWPLVDPDDGSTSFLTGRQPRLKLYKQGAAMGDNNQNLFFDSLFSTTFLESGNSL